MTSATFKDSLLVPAVDRPGRTRAQRLGDALALPIGAAVMGIVPAIVFVGAYRNFGAMPWDFGLLDKVSRGAPHGLATDPEILLGLGWLFMIPFTCLLALSIASIPLARSSKRLAPAASLMLMFGLTMGFMIHFERYASSVALSGAQRQVMEADYRYARGVLERNGLADEVKALDARYARATDRNPR